MKYTYHDIYKKRIIGVPLWACNYEFDIVKWGKEKTKEPILGEIEQGRWGYDDLRFVPYTKNGRKGNKSHAVTYSAYYYADLKEECEELYCEILQKKIDWCKQKINELEELIKSR